jgi:hypothetical protein
MVHIALDDAASSICQAISSGSSCVVTCTYLEIYNENLYDLLESPSSSNWKKANKKTKVGWPTRIPLKSV